MKTEQPIPSEELIRQLFNAAKKGNIENIRALAAQIDVKTADPEGKTALHIAARYGHVPVIVELVRRGASVSATDIGGWTPLRCAVFGGHIEAIAELVNHGADITALDSRGCNLLHCAASDGQSAVITELAKRGIDVRSATAAGTTAINFAARNGHIATIAKLIELGAGQEGKTPLHYVAMEGDKEVIKAIMGLFKLGANMEVRDDTGRTPLHCAIEEEEVETSRILIRLRANVKAADNAGRSALQRIISPADGLPSEIFTMAPELVRFGALEGLGDQEFRAQLAGILQTARRGARLVPAMTKAASEVLAYLSIKGMIVMKVEEDRKIKIISGVENRVIATITPIALTQLEDLPEAVDQQNGIILNFEPLNRQLVEEVPMISDIPALLAALRTGAERGHAVRQISTALTHILNHPGVREGEDSYIAKHARYVLAEVFRELLKIDSSSLDVLQYPSARSTPSLVLYQVLKKLMPEERTKVLGIPTKDETGKQAELDLLPRIAMFAATDAIIDENNYWNLIKVLNPKTPIPEIYSARTEEAIHDLERLRLIMRNRSNPARSSGIAKIPLELKATIGEHFVKQETLVMLNSLLLISDYHRVSLELCKVLVKSGFVSPAHELDSEGKATEEIISALEAARRMQTRARAFVLPKKAEVHSVLASESLPAATPRAAGAEPAKGFEKRASR